LSLKAITEKPYKRVGIIIFKTTTMMELFTLLGARIKLVRNQRTQAATPTGRTFTTKMLLVTALSLFCFTAFGQYTAITHTSGATAYSGITVTVNSTGSVSSGGTCGATFHYYLSGAAASYTYTFSSPVGSVKLPYINASGGSTTTTQISVNGAPYSLTGANITGTNNQCGTAALNTIVSGNLTNTGNETSFPNIEITIPGPISTITVTQLSGSNVSAYQLQMENPAPAPGPIVGGPVFCIGAPPTTLTNSVTGGTWTSSNPSTVSVGLTTGIATGLAPGIATITYTSGGSSVTLTAIVSSRPAAISGPAVTCVGTSSGLTGSTGGSSTWSSSNTTIATIGSGTGVVNGLVAGTATISYTNTWGCYTTREQTVSAAAGSISGYTTLCAGSTATLTCTPSGGSWNSSNTTVATIGSATGVITGVASGSTYINYVLPSGCSTYITVNPLSQPAAITGVMAICTSGTTTLSSTTTGGTWSTADGAIATIGATTGVVSGVSAGTATMTYTASTGCIRTAVVTVNAQPAASTGNTVMCVGGFVTLANASSGGTWSSSNTSVATVNATSGLLTGVGVGNANITYTITGSACFSTIEATINAVPAPIVGSNTICLGDTATLTHPTPGGTWSGNHDYRATIDSLTGEMIAVSAGQVTMSYHLTPTCYAKLLIAIKRLPLPITGTASVCEGATTPLYCATSAGVWSSEDTTKATINATSGLATGIASGTTRITFSNGCRTTVDLTVNATPAAITGTPSACVGSTTTLSCATGGGTWSSSNTAVATVVGSTGVVSGVSAGTSILSYVLAGGCNSTVVVTIGNPPAAITGSLSLCIGGSTTVTAATSGGTWSSSNTAVATTGTAALTSTTITATGTGTTNISYTVSGCASTAVVTVNAGPAASTGSTSICVGTTTTFTNATSGGTWSSSAPAWASVGATTGIVTGLSAGIVNISYITGSGCYNVTAVTVNSAPAAITGTAFACVGLTSTLSHISSGGTWASSNTTVATIDGTSGVVTGATTGTTTITYTTTIGCIKTTTFTVYGPPSAIGGTGITCVGSATTLTNTTYGGTWSSSNTGIATVGATSGTVIGISDGTATITYQSTASGCYVTKDVTINAIPASISGSSSVCSGGTMTLTCATSGGTWTSSSSSVASIGSASGVVTGITGGGAYISYTLPTGCRNTLYITVVNPPAPISGSLLICNGTTTTLTSATASQTWSSSSTSIATVGSVTATTGLVTGAGTGTATISYTNASGCSRTVIVTVNAALAANTGDDVVCVGQTIALSNATTGGTWASSATAKATVGYYTGVVTGVAAGTANITYKVASGCVSITQVTVNAAPAAITGTTSVCIGQTITLSHASTGGTWSTSSSTATIDGSGVVTGVSAGYAYITYTLSSGCIKTTTVLVRALPHAISGPATVAAGSYILLTDATSGGVWSMPSSFTASMPYTSLGYVYGISAGSTTVTYTVPSTGCYVTYGISVYSTSARPDNTTGLDKESSAFSVFPNPTSGALNINAEVDGEFTVYSLDGKLVQQNHVAAGTTTVSLPMELASGVYMCRFNGNNGSTNMVRLVVQK
jgi:trimeric autotransporter adhesin